MQRNIGMRKKNGWKNGLAYLGSLGVGVFYVAMLGLLLFPVVEAGV